jgi:hypothetical protein
MGSNLALKPGSEVDYGERRFAIMQVISFETVVARDVETGELERLPIAGLRSIWLYLPIPSKRLNFGLVSAKGPRSVRISSRLSRKSTSMRSQRINDDPAFWNQASRKETDTPLE